MTPIAEWIGRRLLEVPSDPGICQVCKGHGDIWVNWHPTPVTCGHFDGSGKAAGVAA